MRAKLKYYDVMLTKFRDKNPSSIYGFYPDDVNLFSEDERKYLNKYMRNMEQLKIQMKGRNKIIGMFL